MAAKFVVLAVFVAAANAGGAARGPIGGLLGGPIGRPLGGPIGGPFGGPIGGPFAGPISSAINGVNGGHSSFSYGVRDPNTGDVKDQHERRVGDSVVGKYSLLESDGTKRVVEYSANPQTGFNAVVRREGISIHPPSPVQPINPITGPLGHGGRSYSGPYASPLGAAVNPLAYGGYGAAANPLAYGGYANPLAYGARGNQLSYTNGLGAYPGYGPAYAGYGAAAYGPNGAYGAFGSSLARGPLGAPFVNPLATGLPSGPRLGW